MQFEVIILGNNSAFAAHGRNPSAQIVNHNGQYYLIDCAEGTQMQMNLYAIKRSRIDHIFISHLHGDHVYGLPGLIHSYTHLSRQTPLHVYGPRGIRQMIETTLRFSGSVLSYDLHWHELEGEERRKILDTQHLKVYSFPLQHRVPTYGYLFVEKPRPLNVRKEAIEEYDLSVEQIKRAKAGKPVTLSDGREVPPGALTEPAVAARSYAYCSDTKYDPELVKWIKGVDLLYHEATFLHDLEDKAAQSMHSTAFQAGMIARLAEVRELLLGHFSSRYEDIWAFQAEAQEAFPKVSVAEEGGVYDIVPIRYLE